MKDCEQLVGELRQRQLRVAAYHPNLDTKQRTNVHDGWRTNKYQVRNTLYITEHLKIQTDLERMSRIV